MGDAVKVQDFFEMKPRIASNDAIMQDIFVCKRFINDLVEEMLHICINGRFLARISLEMMYIRINRLLRGNGMSSEHVLLAAVYGE